MSIKINDFNQIKDLNNSYKARQGNLRMPYDEGFATSSDVYSIVTRIARNGKTLDWILKKKTGDNIDQVNEGNLFDLIHQPNENQSREEFVEYAILSYLLSGEGFIKKSQDIGFDIDSVEMVNPQLLELVTKFENQRNNLVRYIYNYGGLHTNIEKDLITHFKHSNPTVEGFNSLRGFPPLVAGYLTLKGITHNQAASATIFENQGAAGILSNEGDVTLTPEEREREQGMLDKLIAGVRKWGKVIQSSAKIKYTRLGLDPTQLKLIESKVLKFRDLCNIFDVKSILFNDPQSSTFNNLTLAEKSFWNSAVLPNTNAVVRAYQKGIVNDFNEREFPNGKSKYFIELDTSKIISFQEDLNKKASKGKLIGETIINILSSELSRDQKIAALMNSLDYTLEEAQTLAGNGTNNN